MTPNGADGPGPRDDPEQRAQPPIPLGYVRAAPELGPPMTRWQGVAVALFLLSFPLMLALLWLMST